VDGEASRRLGLADRRGAIPVFQKPRRRVADLVIASIAIAEELPLFTTNPDDYKGLGDLLTVVPVTRPTVLHDR
jgi:predicted nucleic acid-binding protein